MSDSKVSDDTKKKTEMLRLKLARAVRKLNVSQRNAVQETFESRVCAIQGPPGTGKTTTIAVVTLQALLRDIEVGRGRGTILCVAETNCAVRHMASAISSLIPAEFVSLKVYIYM